MSLVCDEHDNILVLFLIFVLFVSQFVLSFHVLLLRKLVLVEFVHHIQIEFLVCGTGNKKKNTL